MQKSYQCDVIIIGSGIAGLTAALALAHKQQIHLISKTNLLSGASTYAQGGIAAGENDENSLKSHIQDTYNAGANTNNPTAVATIIKQGPNTIAWLQQHGINFNNGQTKLKLHQEGGHSKRRIYHIADHTGKTIAGCLANKVKQHPNITVYSHHVAIDLIRDHNKCYGAYCYDEKNDAVHSFQAKNIILATGGASKIYLYSSNPETASGDGIAMALRANVEIENLAFNQFHPTCLYHPHAGSFLITEAIRGEGGLLLLPDGTRFMPQFHPHAELAPRDIVARAIDHEMKRLGITHVCLDISHREAKWLKHEFPTIYTTCRKFGIDITKSAIPVVPAAHYTCGGIKTNIHGQTSLNGLYAIGEAAHTGLHGANRLASNSLLECIVMARQAATDIMNKKTMLQSENMLAKWDASKVRLSDQAVVVKHCWDSCRRLMWDYVGIVRSNERLAYAHQAMQLLANEVEQYYSRFRVNRSLIECRNLICVAQAIIKSAQQQKQNIGLHYNLDLNTATSLSPENTEQTY